MNNSSTSTALMVAMVSATTALNGPSSRVATKTVTAVSTSSAAHTETNVLMVGCACAAIFLLPVVVMADQIEQREKVDPDQVDEVPVDANHLHGRVVLRREVSAIVGDQQPGQQSGADEHVQRMHSSHGEVERKEDRHLSGVEVALVLEVKVEARNFMMHPVPVVFDNLDPQEGAAQQQCEQQKYRRQL